jgi:uncharacterized protein DUF6455
MSVFDVDQGLMRRIENMSDMMNRLALDARAAIRSPSRATLGSAVTVCESCPTGDVCHDWLLRAAETLGKAPAFCPNGERFAQLKAEQDATRD